MKVFLHILKFRGPEIIIPHILRMGSKVKRKKAILKEIASNLKDVNFYRILVNKKI